jgi:hypothetical protein
VSGIFAVRPAKGLRGGGFDYPLSTAAIGVIMILTYDERCDMILMSTTPPLFNWRDAIEQSCLDFSASRYQRKGLFSSDPHASMARLC